MEVASVSRVATPKAIPHLRVRSHRTSSRGCSCLDFGEQRSNGSFSSTVATLSDLRVANLAGAIDEVHGRPVLDFRTRSKRRSRCPVRRDTRARALARHARRSERTARMRTRTVDAHDREAGLVLIVHSTQEWEGALAVHAREGPELEQDDAVAKGREPQRLAVRGVEPRIDADQFGSAAEDSQSNAASSSIGARKVFRGGKVMTRSMAADG